MATPPRHPARSSLAGTALLVGLSAIVACTADPGAPGSSGPGASDASDEDFTASLAAPPRSVYPGGDGDPSPKRGRVDVRTETGAHVVIWIEPRRLRRVLEQHTGPSGGPGWSPPRELYRAGDGCLFVYADTAADVVAATLGCYQDDAFGQQAPTQGQSVVTTDLETWKVIDQGEFFGSPEVVADGSRVDWEGESLTWTRDDGFT